MHTLAPSVAISWQIPTVENILLRCLVKPLGLVHYHAVVLVPVVEVVGSQVLEWILWLWWIIRREGGIGLSHLVAGLAGLPVTHDPMPVYCIS